MTVGGKHTGHWGSANISGGFPGSWRDFKSKYTGVGRKGEGVWFEQLVAIPGSGAAKLGWETTQCPEFVSGPRQTVIRQILVTLC